MSQPFTTTGGARIGWMNATWPLARLSVTEESLTLAVLLLGTYRFTPAEVTAVERFIMIPVLGWGIRVRHVRTDCPERIIFWCFGSPDSLLRRIHAAGFVAAAPGETVPQPRGLAVRWSAIVAAVVVWNVLFLADFARKGLPPAGPVAPGPFSLAALLLACLLSVGTLVSPRLQQIVLKPGRSVGEIRPLLRLVALVAGMIFIMFSVMFVKG